MRNGIWVAVVAALSFLGMATQASEPYSAKPASKHTIAANRALSERLPFDDVRAFEQMNRGLIAAFGEDDKVNEMRAGFEFLKGKDAKKAPDTVNPSIYRQGLMNYEAKGLYEVVDGVYQIRGADIANLTIFRTKNGYVINDPGLMSGTTEMAWEFAKTHLPAMGNAHSIKAVIYSHPHGDHFGGVRGLTTDLANGVLIIASEGFLEAVGDENMIGGNAMQRRTNYQYGVTLEKSETGAVDTAIGLSNGLSGGLTLIAPNFDIAEDIEKHMIDGVEFTFWNVPDAEAPVEIMTWVEEYKVLFTGELTFHGMHNIYTIRGAKTRDALAWSKYLTTTKLMFGDRIEALTSSHSAPVWGNADINEYLTLQRDNYGFLHNQTMRLANHGVVLNDIGREIEALVPEAQFNSWHTNGYHGSYSHNARGIINLYLGFHDMNPANLNPLRNKDKSCTYVDLVGAKAMLAKAKKHFKSGSYQASSQLANDVVQCDNNNWKARHLLADSFEQQGYQAETMAWRNSYLQGAMELRTNKILESVKQVSADVIANTGTENIMDYMGVRLNSAKAIESGLAMSFNIVHQDINQVLYSEVSNGNLVTVVVDAPVKTADATLVVDKSDLGRLMGEQVTMAELLETGRASLKGDKTFLQKLMPVFDDFSDTFEIMPLASVEDDT